MTSGEPNMWVGWKGQTAVENREKGGGGIKLPYNVWELCPDTGPSALSVKAGEVKIRRPHPANLLHDTHETNHNHL